MTPSEPVRLTVSEIRQRIFEVSGPEAPGTGSMAGQLFHRAAACGLEDGHPACWKSVLASDLRRDEWARAIYDHALGHWLTRSQSSLRENGAEVLLVWRAVESFCGWFCGLLAEAARAGVVRYDERKEEWLGGEHLFQTECDLFARWREPLWTGEVAVGGRADHLIRIAKDRWCVVEFKLGAGHAAADAAQACLYQELLGGRGSAALVRFGGDAGVEQLVFEPAWMREARPKLMLLIGALAGVLATGSPAGVCPGEEPEAGGQPADAVGNSWPRPASELEMELGKRLIRALHEFHADAQLVAEPLVGPAFVRFLLEPGRGIPANRIDKQGANLQLRLRLEQEPMIGRAAGRIAVDVQRPEREYISFESLRPALKAENQAGGNARVLAGVDLQGRIHFIDLARDTPHLLVGGVPGGGKSEWLRAAVASLVVTNTPDTLRLVLVDPKKNAFAELTQSDYLWRANSLVDSPEDRILPLLDDLIDEMLRRYELFKQKQADDLAHYAAKTGAAPPRIVCVVDEFADLLMGSTKADRDEIERGFVRIAQMGRAAGVHLILATQRPSRQIVSGVLKANIPGKIALRVANRVESGVLLDRGGAENLLGKGDLLLSSGGYDLVRLQSAYLSPEERRNVFGGLRAVTVK